MNLIMMCYLQLGNALDVIHSELLPKEKADIIKRFKREGPTAMVGDGLNDTPALAIADIGISMGVSGSALATETGNVILMSNDMRKIPKAIKLAKKSHAKVVQNVVLSIGTKIAILGLAFAGHPLVWAAVLADVGTCLLVILNSMLLLRGVDHKHEKKCCKSSKPCSTKHGQCNGGSAQPTSHHHHHNHRCHVVDDQSSPSREHHHVHKHCKSSKPCSTKHEQSNDNNDRSSSHNNDHHQHDVVDDQSPSREQHVHKHCCSEKKDHKVIQVLPHDHHNGDCGLNQENHELQHHNHSNHECEKNNGNSSREMDESNCNCHSVHHVSVDIHDGTDNCERQYMKNC